MTNQYHKDDSVNEMLKFVDNALGIYKSKFNCDYYTLTRFRELHASLHAQSNIEFPEGVIE